MLNNTKSDPYQFTSANGILGGDNIISSDCRWLLLSVSMLHLNLFSEIFATRDSKAGGVLVSLMDSKLGDATSRFLCVGIV